MRGEGGMMPLIDQDAIVDIAPALGAVAPDPDVEFGMRMPEMVRQDMRIGMPRDVEDRMWQENQDNVRMMLSPAERRNLAIRGASYILGSIAAGTLFMAGMVSLGSAIAGSTVTSQALGGGIAGIFTLFLVATSVTKGVSLILAAARGFNRVEDLDNDQRRVIERELHGQHEERLRYTAREQQPGAVLPSFREISDQVSAAARREGRVLSRDQIASQTLDGLLDAASRIAVPSIMAIPNSHMLLDLVSNNVSPYRVMAESVIETLPLPNPQGGRASVTASEIIDICNYFYADRLGEGARGVMVRMESEEGGVLVKLREQFYRTMINMTYGRGVGPDQRAESIKDSKASQALFFGLVVALIKHKETLLSPDNSLSEATRAAADSIAAPEVAALQGALNRHLCRLYELAEAGGLKDTMLAILYGGKLSRDGEVDITMRRSEPSRASERADEVEVNIAEPETEEAIVSAPVESEVVEEMLAGVAAEISVAPPQPNSTTQPTDSSSVVLPGQIRPESRSSSRSF